jgi:hypothetical protein
MREYHLMPSTALAHFERARDSQNSFSVTDGRLAFGGADHGWQDIGLAGGALTLLKPFLAHLGHKARRRMCPLCVSGLIGPGDRKSIQPNAQRLAVGEYDQSHHFMVWRAGPVETELLVQADKLVGGAIRSGREARSR